MAECFERSTIQIYHETVIVQSGMFKEILCYVYVCETLHGLGNLTGPILFSFNEDLIREFFILFEYSIIIKLRPSDVRAEASELPNTIHSLVPHCAGSMSVALDGNSGESLVRIFLMRHSHLMRPNNFVLRDFVPFAKADEMLGFDQGVAQKVGA
jgi:hypothetical protein